MARPPKLKPEELIAWIKTRIGSKPIEHEGHTWMAMDQPADAAELGISERTLRTMINVPPIVKARTTYMDGTPVVLLRVGTPEPDNARMIARKMANIFRKRTGLDTGQHAFGCLVGLVEIWPKGRQVDIFRTVMDDWPGFMAGVQCADMDAELAGKVLDPALKERFYGKPVIALIRKYPAVAVELHNMA
ncbi:hypothetical protein [Pararhodobacter aggregans]|uniref:Uncharacterized protein n=1 Tax=Pararhodobacter aggregans TaxID=404875 RepID=A0A2T7UWK3_9RHOB|nr:hypothetical protein [Pararhodobacter aggregans]PTX04597.1 hypothetical protein C8N33_1015 [Pararhodobacter aggregans]PVE48938.1 hypothetical protein DDE23_00585 [Pararhodobacter aggregans]